MRRYRIFTMTLLASGTVALGLGCGGGDKGGNQGDIGPTAAAPGPVTKTPLDAKEWTTVKGRVVFDGDLPTDDGKLKMQMAAHGTDSKICLEGDTGAFNWRVNPENKGVANVVIWIEPPDDKYFKPTPDEGVWKKEDIKIDQPHCAFEPHVSAAFVGYSVDGKKTERTTQKIKIVNTAPMKHNTQWAGHGIRNPGDNPIIDSMGEYDMTPKLKADPTTPIKMSCNIHQWMRGVLWALDTPYYAVTDKDGNFEIKGVPAGTPVQLVEWQESREFLDGQKGKKVTFKPGTDDLGEIKITAKK